MPKGWFCQSMLEFVYLVFMNFLSCQLEEFVAYRQENWEFLFIFTFSEVRRWLFMDSILNVLVFCFYIRWHRSTGIAIIMRTMCRLDSLLSRHRRPGTTWLAFGQLITSRRQQSQLTLIGSLVWLLRIGPTWLRKARSMWVSLCIFFTFVSSINVWLTGILGGNEFLLHT